MTNITFFDCETTGRLNPECKIIEASFRVCDLETQKEVKNIRLFFNPERNIEAKATAVHGMTLEDVKHYPTFKEQIKEIINILTDSKYVVAHNGNGFDFPLLVQEFEAAGEIIPDFQALDTMVMGTFATDLGKSPTLFELCWSLDVDVDPKLQHKGDYDTEILRDAFFNGLNYGWFKL